MSGRPFIGFCWEYTSANVGQQNLKESRDFHLWFGHPSKTQYIWRMLVIYFKNGSVIISKQGLQGLGGGSLASALLCLRNLWILSKSPPPCLGVGIMYTQQVYDLVRIRTRRTQPTKLWKESLFKVRFKFWKMFLEDDLTTQQGWAGWALLF